ncbi:uncharacterized protein LOC116163646 [Photinus pyralis]|uniref:uncharacterized protein LOC116163646 n=1 Tax=Photinus pyralis TaxID=7054 RepID=UPI001266F65A|nr:uncharacterized protein LOC116163646 [Photinus pyralis]
MSLKLNLKRKCVFTDNLKTKYPFLRKVQGNESDVYCSFCSSKFSIGHGGNADVIHHVATAKHKSAVTLTTANVSITKFCKSSRLDDSNKKLAAAEGTWAYHLLQHNHSFRSGDCTSKLIKSMFEPKYSSARTKSEAIICAVFEPMAMETVQNNLNAVNFVTVCCDASNHKHIKLMPILVRYFLPMEGIQLKLLDLKDLPGETSAIICTNAQLERVFSHVNNIWTVDKTQLKVATLKSMIET